MFVFGLFLTSKHPDRVSMTSSADRMRVIKDFDLQVIWRPILWGSLIQLCFGMFILRTEAGFQAFNWTGNIVQTFINYVDAGVEFVYGESWADHSFAFKVFISSSSSSLFDLDLDL